MLGNFSCFCCRLPIFFSKNSFRNTIRVSNSLDPDQDPSSVGPDLCLNCLQRQGWHRLENYLNLEGLLEKSLKIKSALKSTGKSLKSLEKSLNPTIFCTTQHC